MTLFDSNSIINSKLLEQVALIDSFEKIFAFVVNLKAFGRHEIQIEIRVFLYEPFDHFLLKQIHTRQLIPQ